jgi:replicative DNA helicase
MVPHSVEAEEATLGSILIDADKIYEIADICTPDDFFIVKNAWVYEAMLRLSGRNEEIDYITVLDELKKQSRIEEIGGPAYITYLLNNTPSSIYGETYARIVNVAAIRRRMLSAASEIAQLAHEEDTDINGVIDRADAALSTAVGDSTDRDEFTAAEVAETLRYDVEDRRKSGEKYAGIPCGFYDIDDLIGGFSGGNSVIVAGRPGLGKTSLLITMAVNMAKGGNHVILFSLEMSEKEIMQRIVSMLCGVSSHKIRIASKLTDTEFELVIEATHTAEALPIHIVAPKGGLTPLSLHRKARRLYKRYPVKAVMVDYLQLMKGGSKSENRTQEVGAISHSVKELARELDVPVFSAAQLNRAVEGRQDKRPALSDLRESGDLEQDADIVLMIYRDEEYNENTERPNQADIIIAKHRNGPTGTATLYFRKELTQFANLRKTNVDLAGF